MRTLLTGQRPVIATVGLRDGGFIAEVERSRAFLLWEVTHANRNDLATRIVAWLEEMEANCRGDVSAS